MVNLLEFQSPQSICPYNTHPKYSLYLRLSTSPCTANFLAYQHALVFGFPLTACFQPTAWKINETTKY